MLQLTVELSTPPDIATAQVISSGFFSSNIARVLVYIYIYINMCTCVIYIYMYLCNIYIYIHSWWDSEPSVQKVKPNSANRSVDKPLSSLVGS